MRDEFIGSSAMLSTRWGCTEAPTDDQIHLETNRMQHAITGYFEDKGVPLDNYSIKWTLRTKCIPNPLATPEYYFLIQPTIWEITMTGEIHKKSE